MLNKTLENPLLYAIFFLNSGKSSSLLHFKYFWGKGRPPGFASAYETPMDLAMHLSHSDCPNKTLLTCIIVIP